VKATEVLRPWPFRPLPGDQAIDGYLRTFDQNVFPPAPAILGRAAEGFVLPKAGKPSRKRTGHPN
jgi:hypothetical protein